MMGIYVLTVFGSDDAAGNSVVAIDIETGVQLAARVKEDSEAVPGNEFLQAKIERLLERRPVLGWFRDTKSKGEFMVSGGAYWADTDTVGLLCDGAGSASTIQWFFSAAACSRLEPTKQREESRAPTRS